MSGGLLGILGQLFGQQQGGAIPFQAGVGPQPTGILGGAPGAFVPAQFQGAPPVSGYGAPTTAPPAFPASGFAAKAAENRAMLMSLGAGLLDHRANANNTIGSALTAGMKGAEVDQARNDKTKAANATGAWLKSRGYSDEEVQQYIDSGMVGEAFKSELDKDREARKNAKPEWKVVDKQLVRIDPNSDQPEWMSPPGGAAGGGGPFSGNSVEAQSLNWLVTNGNITAEQAAQVGAGKPVTGADGSITFMTPEGIFSQTPGGQPQPISPAGGGAGAPGPSGSLMPPPGGSGSVDQYRSAAAAPQQRPGAYPLAGPKDKSQATTEAERRNRQLYEVAAPELATVEKNFDELSSLWNQGMMGALGEKGGGNFAVSGGYQQARNSLKAIVKSYLYSVSGSAATDQETQDQVDILTPKPGEGEAAIQDKRQRVRTMVEAIRIAANQSGSPGAPMGGGGRGGRTSSGVSWTVEP